MKAKTNILFVCEGNIHRSVVAEYLLRENIGRFRRNKFEINSCGVDVNWYGIRENSKDSNIITVLGRNGHKINPESGARQFISEDLEGNNLILTFTATLENRLKRKADELKLSGKKTDIYSISNYLGVDKDYDLENPNEYISYLENDGTLFRVGRATWRRPFQKYVHPNDDKLIAKMYEKFLYKPLERQIRLVTKKVKREF